MVVTRCDLGFNQPPDCGHNPPSNGQWTFAGSGHSIHQDDRALDFGHVCSASAGSATHRIGGVPVYQTSFGLLYDSDGHPVGHSGTSCGTFTPDTATVSISGVTVTEGGRAELTITSSGGLAGGTVDFATADGSAAAGSDYTATSGRHTFLPGQLSKTVNVPTTNDTDVESSETFTVRLFNPSGVDIGTASATATIIDNDSLGTVSISGATVTEGGTAEVTVTLSGGNVTGTVNYATADGSATALWVPKTRSWALTCDDASRSCGSPGFPWHIVFVTDRNLRRHAARRGAHSVAPEHLAALLVPTDPAQLRPNPFEMALLAVPGSRYRPPGQSATPPTWWGSCGCSACVGVA